MYVVVLFVLSVHSFCCLERIYIQTSALKELLFVRLFEFFHSTKVDNARKDARVHLLADTHSNNLSEEEEAVLSSSNNVVKNHRF